MSRELPLDWLIQQGMEKKTGAYSPGTDEQIIAFYERLQREQVEQEERWTDEKRRKRKKCKEIIRRYYGRLSAEQYQVYLMKEGYEREYEEISELTGQRIGTLRKIFHEAKKNIKRMDI